jgi:hypothetical protein
VETSWPRLEEQKLATESLSCSSSQQQQQQQEHPSAHECDCLHVHPHTCACHICYDALCVYLLKPPFPTPEHSPTFTSKTLPQPPQLPSTTTPVPSTASTTPRPATDACQLVLPSQPGVPPPPLPWAPNHHQPPSHLLPPPLP